MIDNYSNDDTILTYYQCISKDSYLHIGNASISSFIVGLLVVIYVTLLFIIIRKNYLVTNNTRFNAFFLPIYKYPVMFIIFYSFIIGILNIIGDEHYQLKSLLYLYTLKWFVYQLCQIVLTVFFLHQGIGIKAIKWSLMIGISWAFLTFLWIMILLGINFNDEYDNLENIIISFIGFIMLLKL